MWNTKSVGIKIQGGRTQCWVCITDSPAGTAALTAIGRDRSAKEAARAEKTASLDYFNYPHPSWAKVTGEHEAELKCLGSLCDC